MPRSGRHIHNSAPDLYTGVVVSPRLLEAVRQIFHRLCLLLASKDQETSRCCAEATNRPDHLLHRLRTLTLCVHAASLPLRITRWMQVRARRTPFLPGLLQEAPLCSRRLRHGCFKPLPSAVSEKFYPWTYTGRHGQGPFRSRARLWDSPCRENPCGCRGRGEDSILGSGSTAPLRSGPTLPALRKLLNGFIANCVPALAEPPSRSLCRCRKGERPRRS